MTRLAPEPAGYGEQFKARVRASRVRATRAANSELLALCWSVGRDILQRQEQDGWGSSDRLAADLCEEFPDQRGWSRSNLHYVRALAAAWPNVEDVPQAVGQQPWGHVRVLLDNKLSTRAQRDWYAAAAAGYGWSRDLLTHQVDSRLVERVGAAPSNFAAALPGPDSELDPGGATNGSLGYNLPPAEQALQGVPGVGVAPVGLASRPARAVLVDAVCRPDRPAHSLTRRG